MDAPVFVSSVLSFRERISTSFDPFSSYVFFSVFFLSYERQSLLPNTEAPQELIIQKTGAPRRTRRTSRRGRQRRAKRDGAKTKACVKVGRGCLHLCVCVCVCMCSFFIVNDC